TLTSFNGSNNVAAIATGSGGTAAITFAGLTRTAGVLNFDTATGVNINVTGAGSVNGIVGGYATANGDAFAGVTGTTVGQYVHLAGETNTAPGTWDITKNISLTTGGTSTVAAATTINSLRLDSTSNVTVNSAVGL